MGEKSSPHGLHITVSCFKQAEVMPFICLLIRASIALPSVTRWRRFSHLHGYVNLHTFVLVSHFTSNCCNLRVRCPASWLPMHHGKQWHPGSSTSSNFPNLSLIATVDWSTCTQHNRLPIFSSLLDYLYIYAQKSENNCK